MRYCLALLTHGDAPNLELCLSSFLERLRPEPSEFLCVVDGPGRPPWTDEWKVIPLPEQQGFCGATRRMWREAGQVESPYVFWLEHDFELLHEVDLGPISDLIDVWPELAQMALMRGPVNAEERKAGGIIEKHRQRGERVIDRDGWIQHWSYFTTNPSLMRTSFITRNVFPGWESECEGKFGFSLRTHGYYFGIWGNGAPAVRHIGKRTGFGY